MKKLKDLIESKITELGDLVNHPNFQKRLKWELIEIEVQDLEDYFIDLYEKNKTYQDNENNLLVCKILGICNQVNLDSEPSTKMGEFPDVDVDYLKIVRDYLKNEWAPKTFGSDKVCNIGNYGTFGLKSTLIDMARVHGLDRGEILNITTALRMKDDEGEILTFDSALRLYPELKDYCDRNPEVAQATQKLLHRNRSMGKHAGGLILCNQRIDNFVPLVRGTEGETVSSWVEGLHGQDLGPVGLIKFDLLVVNSLWQIALTARLVKERHNFKNICNHEGQWDWSDTAYLNDAKSIEMANKGDLRCVFQYDSDGIRKLARKSGVTCFEDLVNLVALYRPGPLNMGMDETYALRKRGKQIYELHPVLEEILGQTYGIMIFQEDVMKILSAVGKIPLRDCYAVIKAISKKKIEGFAKYKDKFVENGQIVLNVSRQEVEKLWEQVQSFAEYGFNLSHSVSYSYISSRQLYLKSNYPLEFYAATLMCENNDDKLREYITECMNHEIQVEPLNLNLSKENFSIQNEKIYIGFSNIKGIGEDKAKRIVEGQPYSSFEDFLSKFGTEAAVLKALIPLRIFKDAEPEVLHKFWMFYSEHTKKVKDKNKRFEISQQKLIDDLKKELPEGFPEFGELTEDICVKISMLGMDYAEILQKYRKKILMGQDRFKKTVPALPSLVSFDHSSVTIEDQKILELLNNSKIAETTFYGFVWHNPLRSSPDYRPHTNFENFKLLVETGRNVGVVIVEILDVNVKSFKNNKGKFASITVYDDNFETGRITMWQDDYDRFKEDLKKGNFISIQVTPPSNGFSSFTFYGPARHERYKLPSDKTKDLRLCVLRKE